MKTKVKVKFFGTLGNLVGKREAKLEFEEPITVIDLVYFLAMRYSDFKNYVLEKDGNVRDFLSFLVNGKNITFLEGFKTNLKDGDIVAIITPVGGG